VSASGVETGKEGSIDMDPRTEEFNNGNLVADLGDRVTLTATNFPATAHEHVLLGSPHESTFSG